MNNLALQNQYTSGQRSFRQKLAPKLIYIRNHYFLYLMLVFPVAYYILFHYVPMYGIGIAFRDYSIFTGVRASTWTGFLNFSKIFAIAEFSRAIRNTLVLNVLTLVFGFPAPIILALMLNEIRAACTRSSRRPSCICRTSSRGLSSAVWSPRCSPPRPA